MIELVFVIVVIGILAGLAIPKFAMTRNDAIASKARTTVGSVRSYLAAERQKRILRGEFDTTLLTPTSTRVFAIRMSSGEENLTSYPVEKCSGGTGGSNCWRRTAKDTFVYYGPRGNSCTFKINNRLQLLKQPGCEVPALNDL